MTLPSNNKVRLAVLVSGSGTNLQALIDRAADGSLAADIAVVASDRADAFGLTRAQRAGIPAHGVDYRAYLKLGPEDVLSKALRVDLQKVDDAQKILRQPDREKRMLQLGRLVLAEKDLIEKLDSYRPDFICLAGYMRLVTPYFLSHYNKDQRMRVLNIHPALLPAFPGQHGYEDTFAYGCMWGGITVHFVDEGEDSGPIIAQAVYPIWPEDDVEKVRQRGLELEYEVYAQCINWLAAGQVRILRNGDRVRTAVTDPLLKPIIRNWMERSFIQTR